MEFKAKGAKPRPVAVAAGKAVQAVAEAVQSVANPKRVTWANAGAAF